MSELLTVNEAADLLRVRPSTIYNTLRHRLPTVRVGRLLRYRRADLEAWLDSQQERAA